jgi:hypothetical protein
MVVERGYRYFGYWEIQRAGTGRTLPWESPKRKNLKSLRKSTGRRDLRYSWSFRSLEHWELQGQENQAFRRWKLRERERRRKSRHRHIGFSKVGFPVVQKIGGRALLNRENPERDCGHMGSGHMD